MQKYIAVFRRTSATSDDLYLLIDTEEIYEKFVATIANDSEFSSFMHSPVQHRGLMQYFWQRIMPIS